MSWWGKVVGGAFGFMLGGPLGALMGAALGNSFDGGLEKPQGFGATERVQSVFFTTTFAIMGYIAKIDGKVTPDEIQIAEQVMQQMRISALQRRVAINLFNEGKKDGFPIDEVLGQFRQEVSRRSNLIQMFLEIIIATAFADGSLHSAEQQLLEKIAHDLGYSQQQFKALLGRVTGQEQFLNESSFKDKLQAAHELLGVNPGVADAELKKAYRRQMSQHHPDKLVAKGLPEEMMNIAAAKTREIKAAYELIAGQRK